jgi:hypothetical protein
VDWKPVFVAVGVVGLLFGTLVSGVMTVRLEPITLRLASDPGDLVVVIAPAGPSPTPDWSGVYPYVH